MYVYDIYNIYNIYIHIYMYIYNIYIHIYMYIYMLHFISLTISFLSILKAPVNNIFLQKHFTVPIDK